MLSKTRATILSMLALVALLSGCATTERKSPEQGDVNSKSEKMATGEDTGKAMQKISMAIGLETSQFAITSQQPVDAPGGYNGTQYTVKTSAGKTYKCEILEPSGFGKMMTWGMASGASAMCTDFTPGSKDRGKTNKASCNDLLRAAGKC